MNTYDDAPLLGWQIEDMITEQMESMQAQLESQQAQLESQEVMLTKQTAAIEGQQKQFMALLAEKDTLIAKLQALVMHYEAQLTRLKRHRFGSSSERSSLMDSGQLSLLADFANLFDNADTDKPSIIPKSGEIEGETKTEEISYKRKKRIGKREEDLASLPVVRVEYELADDERNCQSCDTFMRDIGITIRREIEIIPAQAIVKEHAVHAYACPNQKCEGTNPVGAHFADGNTNNTNNLDDKLGGSGIIIRADSPKPLIVGSLASPSLVAHIAYQKYSNGIPLYRIEKGFWHDGVIISRQNMSNWVISCAELYLISIYEALKKHLLKESVLHSDATVVQVLREPDRRAQTKSCQWVHRTSGASDKKIVIYEYTQTKGAINLHRFFADFEGFLHTDGADVYHKLKSDITIVGCWAHARRYFENIVNPMKEDERKNSEAAAGLSFINALFKLERDFSNLSPEKRYLARLKQAKPISDAFFAWAADPLRAALPQSPLGKALHYTNSQRKYLENVFLDGRLELSNNRCERSVKPFVMGRKAWLFSNTPKGAVASSVMYSIIETAKENGLHPFHYVKYLLEALPHSTTSNVESLLPWSDMLPDWCLTPRGDI
jgi:transposase